MHIDSSDAKIRNFGILFCVVMVGLAGLSLYRGHAGWPWLTAASVLFLLAGFFAKPLLRPVYIGWMMFAFALGWVNTRLILGVFFYGILFPVGLVLRIIGKDPLSRKIDRRQQTYWIKSEQTAIERQRYERPF
ncbi:MAG: SxtJ family membrane protein [Bacteroidota bacterium]